MSDWSLVYEKFEPDQQGLREALCTLGNGYFATRGAAAEAHAGPVHYPGTYVAGCYNRLETEIRGRTVENEDLVNCPNWLPLTFRIEDGPWFDLASVALLSYRQELDLRRGLLYRSVRVEDEEGRITKLSSRRFVHMVEPHLGAIELMLTPENWSGKLEIRSAIDGRVTNDGVERYRDLNGQHLEPLGSSCPDDETICLKVQTSQSEIRIAEAARTRVFSGDRAVGVERRATTEAGYVAQQFSVAVEKNSPLVIEKVAALFTSRDPAISECGLEARKAVARAGRFDELFGSHSCAWEHLWQRFDIAVDLEDEGPGPQNVALILRLHLFQMLQTVSLNSSDLDVGAPARGLHGEAYRGHIFWDELFLLPVLNLHMPQITRGLLMYRYRRLDEARAAARAAGFTGAMFPWQSGSNGREESQIVHLNPRSGQWIPDNTRLQRHVGSAIAYNVWHYYQVTGDVEFLLLAGAEMILEIARFWASIASYNEELDRYEILGVMGPDEYHDAYPDASRPGLDNNAYTNVMAVWVLCRALDLLETLPRDRRAALCDRLDLHRDEIDSWDEISRRMRIVFHDDGVISQFEGYENLQELDWEAYRAKYDDIQRLDRILDAEGDTVNRYKASKQADVLMLFYLFSAEELGSLFERLGYRIDSETIPRNIDYYLRRTSHGSTLSRVVHSWVLARSDRPGSWKLFSKALESDVADVQGGTTQEGIHLGAMGGTVDLIQRCITGLETRGDVLWLNPHLPEPVSRLELRIHYRGHSVELEFTHERVKVTSLPGYAEAIEIGIDGQTHELEACQSRRFRLPSR